MANSEKPIIIYGTGAVGKDVRRELTCGNSGTPVAFSVDGDHITDSKLLGLPVIPHENIYSIYPPEDFRLIIAVGYGDRGKFRIKRYQEAIELGYDLATCVSKWAITWESFRIGAGSILCAASTLCPSSTIGKNVFVAPCCTIPHDTVISDHAFLSAGVSLSGGITVESGAFIGTGAVVRNGVTIGRNSIVGAGAVILENVEPDSVYMAAPAEKLPIARQDLNME